MEIDLIVSAVGIGLIIIFIVSYFILAYKADKDLKDLKVEYPDINEYQWSEPTYTSTSYTFPWISTTTTQTIRKRVKKKFQRKPSYMKRKPKSEYQYIFCSED